MIKSIINFFQGLVDHFQIRKAYKKKLAEIRKRDPYVYK